MSGPKHYAPPPRYSLQVFDGNLNEVFQCQSKLKLLLEEIHQLKIHDENLNIHFDCKAQLQKIEAQLKSALERLVFNYKGSFGQDTYTKISTEIQQRIQQLDTLTVKCNEIIQDFHSKELDYTCYAEYNNLCQKSKDSFSSFKNAVDGYLKNNTPAQSEDVYAGAHATIQAIELEDTIAPFKIGFQKSAEKLENELVNQVYVKEQEINAVRIAFNDKIIERHPHVKLKKVQKKSTSEVAGMVEKINKVIASGLEPQIAEGYRNELESLQESETLVDVFYYSQLHDRIIKLEKAKKNKLQVQQLLVSINAMDLHENLANSKSQLVNHCIQLLDKSSVDIREVNRIIEGIEELKVKSNAKKQEEEIAENERVFLKSQIVNSLENMGYVVMDDLEVIDFEKADDLLLKCKDEKNYLNLKFKEDGSIRYVFQIPEKKETLEQNELNSKLAQMDETCSDFRKVLSDLAKMGLKMELKEAKPTSEKWLLTLTEKQKQKVKPQKKKTNKKEEKKKYLD